MKKLLVVMMGVLLLGSSVQAQEQGRKNRRDWNPEQRAERMTSSLKEEVSLPEEKWEQLSSIYETYYTEVKQVREQEDRARERDRSNMKVARESLNEKLQELLTEEEFAAIQEAERKMMEERRHHRKGHHSHRKVEHKRNSR